MKTLVSISLVLFLCCGVALAADVTGKWVAEQKFAPPGGGEERIIKTTFDLKSTGNTITGTISGGMGRQGGDPPPPAQIKEGKLDGNKFTIKVARPGRDGAEVIMVYEGTIEGDVLKGTSVREGGQGQPRPFEAKKQ
jgi:hypothetical protein